MDNYQIETAQNVEIYQNIANLGERILAFLIDTLIIIAYGLLTGIAVSSLGLGRENEWIYMVVIGLPMFLYHLLMETFNNGQSLGKAAMHIRVVKLDGSKPAFSNYAIRWLLRMIDITFTTGAVAVFAFLFNSKGQRLGDIAATTTVISEKQKITVHHTLMASLPDGYQPKYPQVTVFSDEEMQQIKNIFQKAKREQKHAVILALAKKSSQMMQISLDEKPLMFIDTIILDYNFYTQQ
ncbi:RDD family protein [Mesonia ostreae]|uniref:RDD family protein n=1 Tax=Mesonia ostreae TaxID=861110 RepID=A0ABU2KLT8_9FLAO|nr:RDD family protein [Mesonia ostreae]MDT0295681.1 RDD family protein [Mesonia ostreae]